MIGRSRRYLRLLGDTVNTAARLCSFAGPWQVALADGWTTKGMQQYGMELVSGEVKQVKGKGSMLIFRLPHLPRSSTSHARAEGLEVRGKEDVQWEDQAVPDGEAASTEYNPAARRWSSPAALEASNQGPAPTSVVSGACSDNPGSTPPLVAPRRKVLGLRGSMSNLETSIENSSAASPPVNLFRFRSKSVSSVPGSAPAEKAAVLRHFSRRPSVASARAGNFAVLAATVQTKGLTKGAEQGLPVLLQQVLLFALFEQSIFWEGSSSSFLPTYSHPESDGTNA